MKIRKTKEVFAETEIYERVESQLETEGHITLSGASGEGKTFLALMLGIKYKMYGYDLVFVNDVDNFRLDDYIVPGRKVFLILDDIFGSVGLSTDVPQLKRILHSLQLCIEEKFSSKGHKSPKLRVVFTTKSCNLECGMSKLEGHEFLFFKGPSVIDLSRMKRYTYSFEDKNKIFQKHKENHAITVDMEEIYEAGQTMFGFPLTCKLFFEFHSFQNNPKTFFKEPLFYLRRELQSLLDQKNEKSAALILMLLLDGQMDLKHVETEYSDTSSDCRFTSLKKVLPNVSGSGIAEAARNFRGTFFTEGDIIEFSHPTIYDACGCALYKTAPTFVLENCSLKFLYERVHEQPIRGTTVSDHLHVIYISDAYNDIIAQRLAEAIAEGNYSMSITHPILKRKVIVDKVFDILKLEKTNWIDWIVNTERNKKEKILHTKENGKHLLYWTVQAHSLYLVEKIIEIGYNFTDTEVTDAFLACASCGNFAVMKVLMTSFKLTNPANIHTAAITASENNYSEIVSYLIGYFRDISNLIVDGKNLLEIVHNIDNAVIEKEIISFICRQQLINVSQDDLFGAKDVLLHYSSAVKNINMLNLILPVSKLNSKRDGFTPVMRAVLIGKRNMFDLLVSRGADLTLTDNDGNSVLHLACIGGYTYIVGELLPFFDINIRENSGLTPVMWTAQEGKRDVFDLLVSKGADLTLKCNNGNNVLHYACTGGYSYIVDKLLPLFDINIRGNSGLTPVMCAANTGKRDLFDLLVSKGADLTLTSNDGNNVLHHACIGGDTCIVDQLLPLFDINIRGNSRSTPVMWAVYKGKWDVFDLLVSKGADLTLKSNNGNNILHLACIGGYTFIVGQLLPLCDINIRGSSGLTPVMWTAHKGKRDVFDVLVSKGADLTLTDNDGDNVLHHAFIGGDTYIVCQLLPLFDINIRGNSGLKPVLKKKSVNFLLFYTNIQKPCLKKKSVNFLLFYTNIQTMSQNCFFQKS